MATGTITSFPINTILEFATSAQYGLCPQLCATINNPLEDCSYNYMGSELAVRKAIDPHISGELQFVSVGIGETFIGDFDSDNYAQPFMPLSAGGSTAITAYISGESVSGAIAGTSGWINLGLGANSTVYVVERDSRDTVYIGGSFTSVNGISMNRIAKWEGDQWSALGNGLDDTVRAITTYSGLIMTPAVPSSSGFELLPYISHPGYFTDMASASGDGDVYLTAWTGDIYKRTGGTGSFAALGQTYRNWMGITVAPDGDVYACDHDGDIYKQAGGSGNFVVEWATTDKAWSDVAAAPNGDVYASVWPGDIWKQTNGTGAFVVIAAANQDWSSLAVAPNGDVYASVYGGDIWKRTGGIGSFVALGGTSRNWTGLTVDSNGDVYASVYGLKIYRQTGGTGSFDEFSNIANANGITSTNTIGHLYICSYNYVYENIIVPGTSATSGTYDIVYAGGDFLSAGTVATNRIARWNGSVWAPLSSGMNNTVNTLDVDVSGKVYAGGSFTTAGGITVARVAAWNGSTSDLSGPSWSTLGTGLTATVYTVETSGTDVYAGGEFQTAGGNPGNRIAKWNGSAWSALGTGMNNTVRSIDHDVSGNIYAGGDFTTAGGLSADMVAKWNGSVWSSLSTGLTGSVYSVNTGLSGNVFVGGTFTESSGISPNTIYWNGSAWQPMASGTNSQVYGITTSSTGITYVGGAFSIAGNNSNCSRIGQYSDNQTTQIIWTEIPGSSGTVVISGYVPVPTYSAGYAQYDVPISVQGGKYQYSKTIDLSAYVSTEIPICTASMDDVIGKIFIKCITPANPSNVYVSIGTSSDHERYVTRFTDLTGTNKLQENWYYGSGLKYERDWIADDTPINLYIWSSTNYNPFAAGELGVSIFFDHLD